MPKAIFLSGFGKNGFYDTVAKVLQSEITDADNLVFIPSEPDNFTKTDDYTPRIFGYFTYIGLDFNSYSVIDERMTDNQQAINAVASASCVFLMGGMTLIQFEYIKQRQLIEPLLNHKGTVLGLSAGAMNMGKRSAIANPGYPPVTIYDGLGLADITVIPHFGSINMDYIKNEILPRTYGGVIYGMCDDAVITVKDGDIKYNGTIYELTPGNIKLMPGI